jgi:O-antigen/teichoic acid export membrane protein
MVSLLQSVVAEAASLALVAQVEPSASNFLLGRLLAQIAATILALVFAQPKAMRVRDRPLALEALGYALPLVPAVLGAFALDSADRLIVQSHLGPTEVARYQIAYNIGSAPILLLSVLNSAWMPRFFALGEDGQRAALLADSRDALYRLLSPVIIGLSFGAPILLRVWAPERYHPEQLLFVTSIVIISSVPYTAAQGAMRGLMAAGRTAAIAVATLVAAAVNVGLNLVLVPGFALIGSAAATAVAYCLLLGLLLRAQRATPIPRTSPALLLQLAAAVVVAVGAAALPASPAFLFVRAVLVLGTIVWFGRVIRELSTYKRPAAPAAPAAPTRSAAPIQREPRAQPRH